MIIKNRIPNDYQVLFSYVFKLKAWLQRDKSLGSKDKKDIVMMLMIVHYLTFMVNALSEHTKNVNKELSHYIRLLIEDILSGDVYDFSEYSINKLVSFCDQATKYFNITPKHIITISVYEGNVNYKIYSALHEHKKIFDYSYCWNVSEEMLKALKINFDIAKRIINKD